MSEAAVRLFGLVIAMLAAGWAAVLALAEESPNVARALVDAEQPGETNAVRYRRLHVSRLALLLLSAVATGLAGQWWTQASFAGLGVALIGAGFLYMVADALPRAVSTLAPGLAMAVAPHAVRSTSIFRPLHRLVAVVERAVHSVLPKPKPETVAGTAQRDLLLGVFSLGDTTVEEIMTPRLDVIALDNSTPWGEVLEVARRSEHARIPVFEGTADNVTGILYAKDLVPAVGGLEEPPERWQDLVQPVQFVPESKTVAAQLRDFQSGASHLAVVVDEFGGTAGIVTLEDVLEEVVGEIHDEYDVEEQPAVVREGSDKFWVDGGVTLDELNAVLESSFAPEDVSTVGGVVYAELGRVPNPGDEFRLGEFRVVVEQVVRRRVRRVYFERQGTPPPAEEEAT